MRRLSALLATLLLAVSFSVCAQSSEEQYVRIYNLIQQADALNGNGQFAQALPKYLEAQSALQRIQKFNPTWNPKVVSYRLGYIAERIEAGPGAAATSTRKAPTPPTAPSTPANASSTPEPQRPPVPAGTPGVSELQNTIARLQADKSILEAKLKEALATQPTAADPRELAKAQERIQSLLKENELLKTNLETEKARPGTAADTKQIEELKNSLAETNKKLTDESARANMLLTEQQELQKRLDAAAAKSANEKNALLERINQLTTSAVAVEALRAENAILKQQVTQTKTVTVADDDTRRRNAEAEARIAALQSDAQVLRLEKLALENKLTKSAATAPTNTNMANKELVAKVDQLTKEVTGLRARVEVFEARAVPYTTEELALFQTDSTKALAYTPDPKRKAARTLSAGSAALVAEAQRNFAAKDYTKAEQNYLDILRQDEGNPTALANLATIQMEAGRLEAAEKSIQQALTAEPNDGYNLATLGKIKYQEEKYDEALDALSRAAKAVPQNAEIQNYLGVTLSQKGQRGPAETALRKAIQIDSNYGSAHNNLAVIYATQTPPLIELARWHYQKALAAGHPKNEVLEKLFDKKESAAK